MKLLIASLSLMVIGSGACFADGITLQDLFSVGDCSVVGGAAGCYNLTVQNTDTGSALNSNGALATGSGTTGTSGTGFPFISVTGSNGNPDVTDPLWFVGLDPLFGDPIGTLTYLSVVVTPNLPGLSLQPDIQTLAGDLSFNWSYTSEDAGSFFDPAGYVYCPATSSGFPSGLCGFVQLTQDLNALDDPTLAPPFAESGTTFLTLNVGDEFGAYVFTPDNQVGPGTMVFSDVTTSSAPSTVPEPGSLLLIGGGLMFLGWGAKKRAARR